MTWEALILPLTLSQALIWCAFALQGAHYQEDIWFLVAFMFMHTLLWPQGHSQKLLKHLSNAICYSLPLAAALFYGFSPQPEIALIFSTFALLSAVLVRGPSVLLLVILAMGFLNPMLSWIALWAAIFFVFSEALFRVMMCLGLISLSLGGLPTQTDMEILTVMILSASLGISYKGLPEAKRWKHGKTLSMIVLCLMSWCAANYRAFIDVTDPLSVLSPMNLIPVGVFVGALLLSKYLKLKPRMPVNTMWESAAKILGRSPEWAPPAEDLRGPFFGSRDWFHSESRQTVGMYVVIALLLAGVFFMLAIEIPMSFLRFGYLLWFSFVSASLLSCVEIQPQRRFLAAMVQTIIGIGLIFWIQLQAATGLAIDLFMPLMLVLLWLPVLLSDWPSLNIARQEQISAAYHMGLRVLAIFWVNAHLKNITQANLYAQYSIITLGLGAAILIYGTWKRSKLWIELQQCLMSIFFIQMALSTDQKLLVVILFLSIAVFVATILGGWGTSAPLHRLAYGALGGAVWLCLLTLGYLQKEPITFASLGWIFIFSISGFLLWARHIPSAKKKTVSPWIVRCSVLVQALILFLTAWGVF